MVYITSVLTFQNDKLNLSDSGLDLVISLKCLVGCHMYYTLPHDKEHGSPNNVSRHLVETETVCTLEDEKPE